MKWPIFIVLILLFPRILFSQDSIQNHSAKKAALLSLVIPGSGQVYNQIHSSPKKYNAYWKIPLIYASLIVTGDLVYNSVVKEKELKKEYYNRINSIPTNNQWSNYDAYNILTLHASAKRNRDLLFFAFAGLYAIQVIDASIEAHFMHFDISPSLSINWRPTIIQSTACINLSFNLH
jgi:hypothetical protein